MFLLLHTTSSLLCLQHSRNLAEAFWPSTVMPPDGQSLSNRSKMQRQDPSQVILPLGRSHSIGAAAVGRVLATRASLQAGSTGDSLSVRATAVLVRVARTLAALPSRCVVVGAASFRCESASTPFILRSPSCGLWKKDALEPPSDYRGFESFEDNAARE